MFSLKFKLNAILLIAALIANANGYQYKSEVWLNKNEMYELAHRLSPGSKIIIEGTILAPRFDFNLAPLSGKDIGLHISVRQRESKIAINSFINGSWGYEMASPFPPKNPGNTFIIEVICENDHYRISMNGVHLAGFPYRLPLDNMYVIQNLDWNQGYKVTIWRNYYKK